ncbi:hypothetical protein GCM10020219_057770 [Nonomuraea dietziae]
MAISPMRILPESYDSMVGGLFGLTDPSPGHERGLSRKVHLSVGVRSSRDTYGDGMRDAYHEELDSLTDKLVEMTRLVRSAISRATTALLDADLPLAESVISHDEEIDRIFADIEAPPSTN